MLLVILINIQQRRYPHASKKRKATLLYAVMYMAIFLLLIFREHFLLPAWLEWPILAAGILTMIIFRKHFFPFKRKCVKCGAKLSFDQWMGSDENLCTDCFFERHPELKPKEEKIETPEERIASFTEKDKVEDIDWGLWEPDERCVLCYVQDKKNNKVLLIEKLRGLGNGLINGPGGHIELEETAKEAAIREVKEETGLDIDNLEKRGELYFQFKDGLKMIGYVFFTDTFSGELLERTDETVPFWCDKDKIDLDRMWADDRIWLYRALEGEKFIGHFIFDDRTLVDSRVSWEEEL